jgi:cyclic pyranopterin phosphate synthase
MPTGGIAHDVRCAILPFRDFLTLIKTFARLGVRKFRITGGEPLTRRGVIKFIDQVRNIPGVERLALTTNGVNLAPMAAQLKDAGISTVNVSLDSLDPHRYQQITGHNRLQKVLDGIDVALAVGIKSVKINMVVMRGINDDEVSNFVQLTKNKPLQVRFLEFMPTTPSRWDDKTFLPMDDVRGNVEQLFTLSPINPEQYAGPASIYSMADHVGTIGFIAAVTHHFCGGCNRLRLTSSGGLVTCLFGDVDANLGAMVAKSASDAEIESAIRDAVTHKGDVRHLPTGTDASRPFVMPSIGG